MTILESLILRIKAVVNSNGTQAIRGDNLQNTLVDIAQTVDAHFAYKNGDPNEDFTAKDAEVTNVTGINATFENIVATQGITAPMFTVRMMAATGGIDITSAANAKLTNVVDGDDYWQCFYKCAGQLWKPLDQARIQSEFGGFLWGLVTAASEQPNDRGEYSFNISKTTVANGSNATPKVDDVVVLYGHRGADKYRQSLFIKSCGVDNPDEDYEPYEAKYVAINSFSLPKSKCTKWDGLTFDIAVNSFSIIGRDGSMYQQPNDRGGHVSGSTYYAFDRVSRDGSVWQCVADSTTAAPSDGASDWVCVVPKGEQGGKGDYSVQGYRWAENKPQRPVGSSPEGWSAGSERGVAIINGISANSPASDSTESGDNSAESGDILTDESGAVLLEPYPASYRLWGSTATFDGATGEVVGEWSDPYQMTAEDGKDGQDGKDVDPTVVDALQGEIDAAKAEALKLRLFRGEFKAGTVYFNNNSRQDIVRYENIWYSYIGADGVAASWSAANWKSYLLNAESIATELLLAEEANIANFLFRGGKLTSQTLGEDGTPNLSLDGINGIVKATEGNFGSAYFDSDGTLTIREVSGATVSTFTRGDINTLSELLEGNELGSSALTGFSDSSGASDKFEVSVTLGGSITTSKANADVTVSGVEMTAWVSGITQGFRASARAELFNDKGEVFSLGFVRASIDSGIRSESKTIQFTGKMATAGIYRVRVVYSMNGSEYGEHASANISVSGGTISKLFTKATNESQLGRGVAVIFDALNYLHYGNNPANNNRKELVYKGYSDLPGVLAKARVDGNWSVSKKWGAYSISQVTNTTIAGANKRIYHNVGHDQYTAICTPYGRGSVVEVIREDSDSVYVYATGGFNIQLLGDN